MQPQQIDEIIELVASQAGTGTDTGGKAANKRTESVLESDDINELGDSLMADAVSASKNLHAEIANLTSIVQKQQKKIRNMESMLTKILSLLESTGSSGQQNQTTPAAPAAPASSTNESRRRVQSHDKNGTAKTIKRKSSTNAHRTNLHNDNNDSRDQHDGHFTMIVHRTLNDVSRRKKNVIITGLMEEKDAGKNDYDIFGEFCENFMPIKPSLPSSNCCKRIGRSIDGRPRRLLVHLQSKEAADELLEIAPLLRHCDDSYVAANVFINEDLSPAEAKLAYEARQKRRQRQQQSRRTANHDDTTTEETEENLSPICPSPRRRETIPGKNINAAIFTTLGAPSADHSKQHSQLAMTTESQSNAALSPEPSVAGSNAQME